MAAAAAGDSAAEGEPVAEEAPDWLPPPPPEDPAGWVDEDEDGEDVDEASPAAGHLLGTAIYDWEAKQPDQITFSEGETIEILDQHESGWWWGRTLRQDEGCFPHNYVVIEASGEADVGPPPAAHAEKRVPPAKPPPPKQHQRGPSMRVAAPPAKPIPLKPPSTIAEEPAGALKEGMLFKKAMGKSKLGKSNWKMRFFSLDTTELGYYESWGGAASGAKKKGAVALADVTAVKLASSSTKANTFVVIVGSKELQIQAATKAEADEWMTAIKDACSLPT